MTLDERIEKAGRLIDLWNRVCREIESGKAWEDIDDGLRPPKQTIARWEAYMRGRMYHALNDIVLTRRANTR